MTNDVTLPALGESVTEGTVTRWLKKVGDTVAADEPLLEISTDKVDTEIPSPFAGTLLEILVQEDDTIEVGAVLARIGESGESAASAPAAEPAASPAPEPEATPEPEPVPEAAPEPAPEPAPEASPEPAPEPAASGDTQDVTLPALGESVTEGTVTRWLKNVGDAVAADEPLLEISTDKVDTEIPSPFAGTLVEIVAKEDDTIEVGAVLARIGGANVAPAPQAAPKEAAPEPAAASEPTPAPAPEPAAQAEPAPAPAPAPAPQATPAPAPAATSAPAAGTASGYVTPLVRKLAAERGVDLSAIKGTGVGGRIRKEDVEAAGTAAPAVLAAPPASPAKAAPAPAVASELRGTTVKMSRVRKVISDVMMDSLHGMAQLTTIIEVDMGRVWDLRSRAKDSFQEREGANLTFLPFFTKAVAEALTTHASLNASIDGDSIVYHPAVNVGIAVDTEKGLMVPVIKDAESKSLADHAREIADLADRARNGGLTPDEMSGATFTVTNTGSGGTLMDTPIVAKPQVGILATCAITKKPVAVKGPDGGDVIAIRPMCYLPLSYDHRLVDGADAARFLQDVRKRLEEGAFESDLGL